MGDIFWVAKISKKKIGVLEISDILRGWMVDARPELTYIEKTRAPPPPPPPPRAPALTLFNPLY